MTYIKQKMTPLKAIAAKAIAVALAITVTSVASAQSAATDTGKQAATPQTAATEPAPAAAVAATPVQADAATPENTFAACKDQKDNDNDTFVDCADQDCGIFAICATPKTEAAPAAVEKTDTVNIFERGNLCKDGIDNDNNGLIDCHDATCKTTRYCQQEMYDYPNDPYRAPGVFFQVGMGLALPNANWKDTRVNSTYGTRVPFDPDTGGMMNFKMGIAPIPWFGLGMNFNFGGTFASNREEFISITDSDDKYKYDGYKVFGHVGGFVRLQYPAKRFTAYLDVAGGVSAARYKWRIYDAAESWSDISDDWDENWEDRSDMLPHDTKYKQTHHFSLVLEPGFDYFVVERKVGIGMHAWLPVYGSSNSGMDNIGILFNATFTPTWREPRVLKDEYK